MAKFLDVKDADPLFPEIAEKCGFDNLKAADERVRNDSTMAEIIKSMNLKKIPTLYRKGEQIIMYLQRGGGGGGISVTLF